MNNRAIITNAVITCLVMIILFGFFTVAFKSDESVEKVRVGFVYESDESTPYSYNFIRAQRAVEDMYGDGVEISVLRNVAEDEGDKALDELISQGCDIIFTTSYGYGEAAKERAMEHPEIEFCQATCANANTEPVLPNYHTFMGEIFEGRYVSGIAAGMKLKALIDAGEISEDEAVAGYVAAFPLPEVISGYTAFLMGIRHVVPSTVMKVIYVDSWSSYSDEKESAARLIDEGCVIISQHSDTIGPAAACEEYDGPHPVFHVGYNQSMIDVAPTTSLVSTRINWTPYITGAVGAILEHKRIEDEVDGDIHGNDCGAGFERDWVQMLELNDLIAAPDTQEAMDQAITLLGTKAVTVFKGDYTGVSIYDPEDKIDLREGYIENEECSAPSFHYILDDVIEIEE